MRIEVRIDSANEQEMRALAHAKHKATGDGTITAKGMGPWSWNASTGMIDRRDGEAVLRFYAHALDRGIHDRGRVRTGELVAFQAVMDDGHANTNGTT